MRVKQNTIALQIGQWYNKNTITGCAEKAYIWLGSGLVLCSTLVTSVSCPSVTLLGDNEPAVGGETTSSSEVEFASTEGWSSVVTDRPSSMSSCSIPETQSVSTCINSNTTKYSPTFTLSHDMWNSRCWYTRHSCNRILSNSYIAIIVYSLLDLRRLRLVTAID